MKINELFSVSNQVIVITGISGQLGIAYAEHFLENGAKVVGLDRLCNHCVEKLILLYPNNFIFISTDITKKKSLTEALKASILSVGNPTVLINNAAIDSPPSAPREDCGPFETYPEESWDKVIDVNLKGVFLSCQIFGGLMAANGRGSIINISSIYGMVSPDQSIYEFRRKRGEVFYKPVAYCASKSGILNMTRYLSVYWAKKGVRVNTLTIAGVFNNQEKEFLDAYGSRIPIGRMANPSDYFGAISFLTSDASIYMTGSNLVVDGAWTAI